MIDVTKIHELGKFMRAGRVPEMESGATCVWEVYSARDEDTLGWVKWRSPWRRYVFHPEDGALFDAECLRAIAVFLDAAKEARCG